MNNAVSQPSLVLIRRLADGADEWLDVAIPQRVETAPGGSYALIDRGASYEAPESLTAMRAGDDLVVMVGEIEALVLGGFFAVTGAEFYPTTNIAGGAGPFSGAVVTPGSETVAVVGESQLVWSAQPMSQEVAAAPIAAGSAGGTSTGLILGGLAVGGLGLAAVGGGGGGGGGSSVASSDSGNVGGSASGAPADTAPPQITSAPNAPVLAENSGVGQVVYVAAAIDPSSVIWSLGTDADSGSFSIDPNSGAVTLTEDPDFENQSGYSFTVVATDDFSNSSQQTVSLAITDIDENPPVITSADTAPAIDENSGAGQLVYTAAATDDGPFSWTLANSDDAAAFTIDADSGAVTLAGDPDFEAQPGYRFTVVATDELGNSAEQIVTLAINDLDEGAPVISSGDTAEPIDENSGAGQVVYTAAAEDDSAVTWQFVPGGDAERFDLDAITGAVTLIDDPDFELQPSYSFTVLATDEAGNSSQQLVSLDINDLDEEPPVVAALDPADGAGDVALDQNIVLTFSEDVVLGTGEIVIRSESDVRTIDVSDESQVSINGNEVVIDPGSDLLANSSYSVQIDEGAFADTAGNPFAGIADETTFDFTTEDGVNISVVVFDLVERSSSDHSDRTFDSDISYDIYIRVDSDDSEVRLPSRARWEGAANLGSDDRIILVGDGQAVEGPVLNVNRISVGASEVAWATGFGLVAGELQGRTFTRNTGFGGRDSDDVRLFRTQVPSSFLSNQAGQLSTMYLTDMPAGVLTSQGLV